MCLAEILFFSLAQYSKNCYARDEFKATLLLNVKEAVHI